MPEHTIIVMNDHEKKLLEYRAKEKRKEWSKRWKDIFWSPFLFLPKLLRTDKRGTKLEVYFMLLESRFY